MELTLPLWQIRSGNRLGQNRSSSFQQVLNQFLPRPANNYYPHLFSPWQLGWLSALLVLLKVASIIILVFGPVLPAYSSAITQDNIINLTNQSRKSFNLNPLLPNVKLTQAAQNKAEDMLGRGYFAHTAPNGRTPWSFINAIGYNYLTAGENLAVNFSAAENVEEAWMNSPSHKANILNNSFEEIGVGIARGLYRGRLTTFVVQMFGSQAQEHITWLPVVSAVQTQVVPLPEVNDSAQLQALVIKDAQVFLANQQLQITAEVAGASKVLASFGQAAVMLEPKNNNFWQAEISLNKLSDQALRLQAFNMSGQKQTRQLANFSSSLASNFNWLATVAGASISVFGQKVELVRFSQNIYLFFIAALLLSLILAITIHKHVQHLSLVANGSLVTILATLLLWSG